MTSQDRATPDTPAPSDGPDSGFEISVTFHTFPRGSRAGETMFTRDLIEVARRWRLLAVISVFLSTAFCSFPAMAASVPADFKIKLVSASLGPPRNPPDIESVTIDASGTAILSPMPSPAGMLAASTLKLDAAVVAGIYQATQTQRFFELKPEYRDPGVRDGDQATLTVTAAGKTKTVSTTNIRVLAFDIIAVAIDRALPPERRLQYNALTEPRLRSVDR
jgi:hypothetical protein